MMIRKTISLWLVAGVCLIATPVAALADFAAAVTAYEQGDYPKAMAEFRSLAQQGHAAAAYNLGVMHSWGADGQIDLTEAARWFIVSAIWRLTWEVVLNFSTD